MKKVSTVVAQRIGKVQGQGLTIGMDLGDRSSWYCVLDEAGRVVLEEKLSTTAKALFYVAPLLVLTGGSSLSAFTAEQLQALALMFLKLNAYAFDICLVFFGLNGSRNFAYSALARFRIETQGGGLIQAVEDFFESALPAN